MKYHRIEIHSAWPNDTWRVTCSFDPTDRVEDQTYPHEAGFYYSPETEGREVGFQKLKDFLILKHETEIARLQLSLRKLRNLQLK